MIPGPDSTYETMKHALVHTISALDAAVEMDVDLTADRRQKLIAEKAPLESRLTTVRGAHQAVEDHDFAESFKHQARVTVGDVVLDQGVRTEKARMALGLKNSDLPGGADYVFGSNVNELVIAELRREPQRVLEAAARYDHVPDFDGKAQSRADLEGRANSQEQALVTRDQADVVLASLRSAEVRAIADSSDALWTLEKRLHDLFPRRRGYVRSFFHQVGGRRSGPGGGTPGGGPGGGTQPSDS